jgi:hypothetical protein
MIKSYAEFISDKSITTESIPKGMDKDIYDFVAKADRKQLLKMQKELSTEIEKGILTDNKYKVELKLINSRLKDSK